MVVKRRLAGGTTNAKRALVKSAKRQHANVSRKEALKSVVAKRRARTIVKQAKTMVKEARAKQEAQKARNRKTHRVLSHDMQTSVNEGLQEAIKSVGGVVSPLTIFAAATSALLRDGTDGSATTKKRAPYLLSAACASLRYLSPNVLVSRSDVVVSAVKRVLNEFAPSDHTAAAKAARLCSETATRMVSEPLLCGLSIADPAVAAKTVEKAVTNFPRLIAKAMATLKALEVGKTGGRLATFYYVALRKFVLHLFTIDDRNKSLFFPNATDDARSDDEWEDVDSNDGEEQQAAPAAQPRQHVHSELAHSALWALRKELLDLLPELVGTYISAMQESSEVVAECALANASEVVSVTVSRCVVEFAGFVLREGGSVEPAQVAMLADVVNPIVRHIVDAFRAPAADTGFWTRVCTFTARLFEHSRLSLFKRGAYAASTLALAQAVGVPPPLHRVVRNPTASAARPSALTADEHAALVARDDAAAAHHQKQLPSLFEIAPDAQLLLRVLDKLRTGESIENPKVVEEAIVAVAQCVTMEQLLTTIPFDPHAGDAEDDAAWSRSYLAHAVWRKAAHHDSIKTFADYFLPRIADCVARSQAARSDGRDAYAQQFEMLHDQYWRVAVGFFHHPVAFDEVSFRNVAKAIVGILVPENGTLRPAAHAGCAALHALCGQYYDLAAQADAFDDAADEDDEEGADEALFGDLMLERDDDVLHPHTHHFIPQAHALRVCALISKYSKNIMPRLCNAAEALDDVSGTPVLAAISSFAKVCAPATMEAILKGIFDVGSNIAAGETTEMTVQRRVILDIAVGIVPQLDAQFLDGIIGIVESAICPPSGVANVTLQKKGYRLLHELFEYRLADFADSLPQVIGSLQNAGSLTTPGARKLRIRCLRWALDACKLYSEPQLVDFGMGFVDELVLCAREQSSQTRANAMEWFEHFFRYCAGGARFAANGVRAPLALLQRVLAALAGRTPLAMSSAILVTSKLTWCGFFAKAFSREELYEVASLLFPLVDHAAAEVRNAAVVFARTTLKLMTKWPDLEAAIRGPGQTLEGSPLAELLRGMAVAVSQPHVASATRTMMRQLLERVLEHFDLALVTTVFPSGSQRFLQYVARQMRRADRVKAREQERSEERRLVAELSSEAHLGKAMAGDAEVEAFDLLQEGGVANLAAAIAKPKTKVRSFVEEAPDDDPYVLSVGKDGKMQVIPAAEKRKLDEQAAREATALRLMEQAQGARRGKKASIVAPTVAAAEINDDGKRKRTAEMEDFENEELFRRYGGPGSEQDGAASTSAAKKVEAAAKGMRGSRAERRNRTELADVKAGEEFESKAGLGDIKKGKVDPYAYVPLNRAMLNKRNQNVRVKRFKLVSHKGLKGQKAQRALNSSAEGAE